METLKVVALVALSPILAAVLPAVLPMVLPISPPLDVSLACERGVRKSASKSMGADNQREPDREVGFVVLSICFPSQIFLSTVSASNR